jgi:hypothetical protein
MFLMLCLFCAPGMGAKLTASVADYHESDIRIKKRGDRACYRRKK